MRPFLIAALGIDPEKLIRAVGTIGLFAVVFAESGIMIGFFLPGDSLLFIAGFLAYSTDILPNIAFISLGCFVAAVAGDQVGYAFGKKTGPRLFAKDNARFFKQEYVGRSEEFFERHGSKAIVLARFVPVVRTFAPIVAGASAMQYRKFVIYNIVGGFLWAVGLTQAGYWLGKAFPGLGEKIELVVVVIVAVSVLPLAIHLLRHRMKVRSEAKAEQVS